MYDLVSYKNSSNARVATSGWVSQSFNYLGQCKDYFVSRRESLVFGACNFVLVRLLSMFTLLQFSSSSLYFASFILSFPVPHYVSVGDNIRARVLNFL